MYTSPSVQIKYNVGGEEAELLWESWLGYQHANKVGNCNGISDENI